MTTKDSELIYFKKTFVYGLFTEYRLQWSIVPHNNPGNPPTKHSEIHLIVIPWRNLVMSVSLYLD